jgi:predicted amidohydrolase
LQMRPTAGLREFCQHAEFFIASLSAYQTDFVVFPEYVNAPLMASCQENGPAAAIRSLAALTEEIRAFFVRMAVQYRVNIITGSLPHLEGGQLRNVVYLCHRDGTWDQQFKLHLTPNEVSEWNMTGGNELKVLDTDCGKVAMLICYDVEFPELGRLLADGGVRILFVPFCTDTASGYHRVRFCSQARAIENECYVAIAGSVGNLPGVANMDFHYAQSAVFSPSDFAFPPGAIVAEATPNIETTVIADIHPGLLHDLHLRGSVRNLQQRRHDLYQLTRAPRA